MHNPHLDRPERVKAAKALLHGYFRQVQYVWRMHACGMCTRALHPWVHAIVVWHVTSHAWHAACAKGCPPPLPQLWRLLHLCAQAAARRQP